MYRTRDVLTIVLVSLMLLNSAFIGSHWSSQMKAHKMHSSVYHLAEESIMKVDFKQKEMSTNNVPKKVPHKRS